MKLVIRKSDNVVMNDRIKNDWRDYERLMILKKQQKQEKDKTIKEQMKAQIKEFENRYQEWIDLRLKGIVRQYGGIPDDYALIQVEEDDIISAMTAKYIMYDGKKFSYDIEPRWKIDKENPGKIIVKAPQWVRGNYTLKQDDITDFREEDFQEDTNFCLEFWQNEDTKDIVVEIFCWNAIETKGPNPPGKRFCYEIFHGKYNHQIKCIEVQ